MSFDHPYVVFQNPDSTLSIADTSPPVYYGVSNRAARQAAAVTMMKAGGSMLASSIAAGGYYSSGNKPSKTEVVSSVNETPKSIMNESAAIKYEL